MNGNFKSDVETRLRARMRARLRKIGYKLVSGGGGFAILGYNEVVSAWTEADGMFPTPYSLTLEDVIHLTHEYVAEAEVAELVG